MKVKLKDIRPNPFRDLTHYRIDEDKVAALVNSIQSTTFWSETVLVREVEDGVEQAFGHHRIEAAGRALGGDTEVEVTLRDLSDADMLRMMAEENLREWKHDLSVQIQTVQAVIDAAKDGRIELPEPTQGKRNDLEVIGSDNFQVTAIAAFLGGNWTQPRVSEIAKHLAYFGQNAASELDGIAPSTAAEIVHSAEVQAKQAGLTGEEKKKSVREQTRDYASRIKGGEKYVLDAARMAAGKQPKHDARLRTDPAHDLEVEVVHRALRDPERLVESLTKEEREALANAIFDSEVKPLREDHARRKAIAEEQYEDPRKYQRAQARIASLRAVHGLQAFIGVVRSERWTDEEREKLQHPLDRVEQFLGAARMAVVGTEDVDWDAEFARLNNEEEVN